VEQILWEWFPDCQRMQSSLFFKFWNQNCLCLAYHSTPSVVWWSEFLVTDPEIPGSISGASRFSENQRVWKSAHSASWGQPRSYLKGQVAAPV
jgi:hypothetical protein